MEDSFPVLFFLSLSSPCVCSLPHGVETAFSRLLRHILSASSTLDLCVFAFSNVILSRAVLTLHKRGVTVRVLSDKDYAAITGSQIGLLRRAGKERQSAPLQIIVRFSFSSCAFKPGCDQILSDLKTWPWWDGFAF